MTNADKFKHLFGIYATELWAMSENDFLEWLNADAQDMQTVERKKGNWIDEGVYADGHGAHAFRCSECGGHIIEYDADPFCKWCGADMRGESDDIPIEYFESGGI